MMHHLIGAIKQIWQLIGPLVGVIKQVWQLIGPLLDELTRVIGWVSALRDLWTFLQLLYKICRNLLRNNTKKRDIWLCAGTNMNQKISHILPIARFCHL